MKRKMNSYRGKAAGYSTTLDRARRFRWRVRVLYGVFAACLLLLAGRAVHLMLLPPEILAKRVQRQHQTVVELSPDRGTIFDRNGRPISLSVNAYSVVADPKEVQAWPDADDPESKREAAAKVRYAARALSPILGMSQKELRQKLSRRNRFSWIKRQISDDQARRIRALGLRGVFLRTEKRRAYPNRELAAGLLGFVNIEGTGLEGLERVYDEVLRGSSYKYTRFRDGKNRDVSSDVVQLRQSSGGGHLVLTLDIGLQHAAEAALARAMNRTDSHNGMVIVMNPHTGELLAVAQAPTFNPNEFSKYNPEVFRNRIVSDVFEPGSTMKPLVIAAALEDGLIHPEETFDCEKGRYKVGTHTIHDTHEYGDLSVAEIVKYSSNIGTAKVAERLGKDGLYDWYRKFGFGSVPNSGLPAEVRGLLRSPKRWSRVALATHGFGQGMSVTALQLASAISAIANGGKLMRPHVVKEVVNEVGLITERYEPEMVERVLSEKTARIVREMMVAVTSDDGTAPLAQVPGYQVAGKTGTAQKVDPVKKRYGKGMYVSSFVGIVPANDPKLVVLTVLDEPQGKHYYGGLVAGPIFREVAMASMQQMGVAPTEALHEPSFTVKVLASAVGVKLYLPEEDEGIEKLVLEPISDGQLTLFTEETQGVEPLEEDRAIIEDVETLAQGEEVEAPEVEAVKAYTLPDFTGQPMREVLRAVEGKEIDIEVSGYGRAIAQAPRPGAVVREGDIIRVIFSPDPVRSLASASGGRE